MAPIFPFFCLFSKKTPLSIYINQNYKRLQFAETLGAPPMEVQMTIPGIAKVSERITKDEFLASLTSQHPVSNDFLESILPTIDAIFKNVPPHLRKSMMEIATDSFRRQSETETIVNQARSGVERLKQINQHNRSRRQRPVHAKTRRSTITFQMEKVG